MSLGIVLIFPLVYATEISCSPVILDRLIAPCPFFSAGGPALEKLESFSSNFKLLVDVFLTSLLFQESLEKGGPQWLLLPCLFLSDSFREMSIFPLF